MTRFILAGVLAALLAVPVLSAEQAPRPPQAPPLDARVVALEEADRKRAAEIERISAELKALQAVVRGDIARFESASPKAVTVPAGYHAHTRADGSTIVHADTNYGDPVAHAGVPLPWPKTALAGDTVFASEPVAADCPGGVCPTGAASGGPVARFAYRFSASASAGGGPVLFPRLRSWLEYRPRPLARLFGRW